METTKNNRGIVIFSLTVIAAIFILVIIYAKQHEYFYVSQRETQTAISSYYMIHEDTGLFDYITPVSGYPWAIPFEFPIYQYIAARIAGNLLPLNEVGRVLSLLFFMGTLFICFRLLRQLEVSLDQSFLLLALLASSPIYLSYSFSFTIETTALFFAVLYLYLYILYLKKKHPVTLILAIGAGILAILTKTTTWVVIGGLIAVVIAWGIFQKIKEKQFRVHFKDFIYQSLVVIIPLISGYLWTLYADSVKMANPLGALATSSALQSWTYGTIAQKFSIFQWFYFLVRSFIGIFGIMGILIPFLLLYRYLKKRKFNRDKKINGIDKKLLLLTAATFFIGPVIFTNLYFEHDYYVIAGGLFLIFPVYFILKDHFKKFLFILLIVSNLITAYFYLYLKQVNYYNPLNQHIVNTIKQVPGEYSLIVFGATFDSFIPYYSHKKALQTNSDDFSDNTFQEALKNMKDKNVGLIVVKSNTYDKIAALTASELGLSERFEINNKVSIYYNPGLKAFLNLETIDTGDIANRRLAKFLKQFNAHGNRVIISFDSEHLFSVVYYRNGNFYMFDFKNGFQVLDYKRYGFGPKSKEIKLDVKDKRDSGQ